MLARVQPLPDHRVAGIRALLEVREPDLLPWAERRRWTADATSAVRARSGPPTRRSTCLAAEPPATLVVNDPHGIAALNPLDIPRIDEAYLAGSRDVIGDLSPLLALRDLFTDRHPLCFLDRFVRPMWFGQIKSDRASSPEHYDTDPRVLSDVPPVRRHRQPLVVLRALHLPRQRNAAAPAGARGRGYSEPDAAAHGHRRSEPLPPNDETVGRGARPPARGRGAASGHAQHRRFQIHQWGCVDRFRRDELQAYRLVMRRD